MSIAYATPGAIRKDQSGMFKDYVRLYINSYSVPGSLGNDIMITQITYYDLRPDGMPIEPKEEAE
jgi:hypothetical protein